MDKFDIYKDIAYRTNGDMYIGVVGPVRTGKSTFITKFMENFVIPNISNKLQRQIATDEMPQSADGKTIMTTQPRFVPANAVKVQFKSKATANVRLIDCVGYFVKGASGNLENDKPRLVKSPWSEEELPFERVAEIGTEKVIKEYSTIGFLVTTDGSFGDIDRENYVQAEDRVVKELKECGKPFVIILNCKNPHAESVLKLCDKLEEKHGVSVVALNALELGEADVNVIIEKVLMEFPMQCFNVDIPKWMKALPCDSPIISELLENVKQMSKDVCKMKDYNVLCDLYANSEDFDRPEICEIKLGEGKLEYNIKTKDGLFFKVLSTECGEEISDDYALMKYIKSFSDSKKKFTKIKSALTEAEENGYGIVVPSVDEMNLEEPVVVKQGGKYGVKLKATAPSLHIMKVDVATEVSPIVGTEKQGQDLVGYIMEKYEDNPAGIWETNMFGKSLCDLVSEGLNSKISSMPKEAQGKMRKTVTRIVNENKGGVICILL